MSTRTSSSTKASAGRQDKQKITPHLWFDKQAEEAAGLYTSLFKNSKIGKVSHYVKEGFEIHGMPEGTVLTVEFELEGQKFIALNGGPIFKFNPSVSFSVLYEKKEEVDALWGELIKGGVALMEIGSYPWSERYGWVADKYGLTWQIMCTPAAAEQKIVPHLMFTEAVCGKAQEAMQFYVSVFKDSPFSSAESGMGDIFRYTKGQEPDAEGTVAHAAFTLHGERFGAMDSAQEHGFTFNEAISFMVSCESQEEIDYYWEKLSADPKSEQCGWLKDTYGLSWQITPTILPKLLSDPDKEKSGKVMQAMLKMKKLNVKSLRDAYDA